MTVKTDPLLIQILHPVFAQNKSHITPTTNVSLAKAQTTSIKVVILARPVRKDHFLISHQENAKKSSALAGRYSISNNKNVCAQRICHTNITVLVMNASKDTLT